jgi:hypothetical protein
MKKAKKVICSVATGAVAVFAAAALSGCSLLYGAGGAILMTLSWIPDAVVSLFTPAATKDEVVEGRLPVSDDEYLYDRVDHTANRAEILYYSNTHDNWLGDGERIAVLDYGTSIAEHLTDSAYWLPLPMAAGAQELAESIITRYFEDVPTAPLDGAGYWYYCDRFQSYYDEENRGQYLFEIDTENYTYRTEDYVIAWYNTDMNRLCYFDWDQ